MFGTIALITVSSIIAAAGFAIVVIPTIIEFIEEKKADKRIKAWRNR